MHPDLEMQKETRIEEFVAKLGIIYLESFPRSECIDFNDLVTTIAVGERWLFTVKTGQKLVGLCTTIPLHGTDLHFGEYLGIDKEFRNRGLGSSILKFIFKEVRRISDASVFVFEAESPDSGTKEEKIIKKLRLKFFGRLGANPVECAPLYRAPDMEEGGTVDMKLMWIPLTQTSKSPSGDKLAKCIEGIFLQSYHLPPDFPLLAEVVEDLSC